MSRFLPLEYESTARQQSSNPNTRHEVGRAWGVRTNLL